MITTKQKWITVLILIVLTVFLAGFSFMNSAKNTKSPKIESFGELSDTVLGGVVSKMPDNSAKIFFETLLGEKLRDYQSYASVDETLEALAAGEISAAWFPDVTADYLSMVRPEFHAVSAPEPETERLEFAMAVKKENTALLEQLNTALLAMKQDNTLDTLTNQYIENAASTAPFTLSDLERVNAPVKTIYVGVTGAVPPIDSLDENDAPIGFSVAVMNEIGKRLNCDIKFVVVKNDTAFSHLMSEKIDVLFCYGTSKDTYGAVKTYAMTTGYYPMYQYSYLVRE